MKYAEFINYVKENILSFLPEASVAYTVCNYYDVDTSEYSFEYIAGWSSSKELNELKASMETIRSTADFIISKLNSILGIKEFKKEGVTIE